MSNDYEFIMNNQQKRSSSLLGGGSMQAKLLMGTGAAVVIVMVIVLFSALFSSGQSASSYIPVAVYQEELLRILENRESLDDTSKLGEYTTLYLAVTSDYAASTGYLAQNGLEITPQQRSPYYYFDLEADLEAAEAANRFDAEFESYLEQALADYSNVLINLEPTPGQTPLHEQAKQNIIYYNGVPAAEEES